ncbi:MAG: PAS domain-containing protein [Planctomycetes bacterium]|nr:PAS domain-containing protein [Planctomycetota bacterium]
MSAIVHENTTPLSPAELAAAMRSFAEVSAGLIDSYQAIERRAQHVENELASKIGELDELSRHLEAILQALPNGVVVRDRDGRVVRINRAACEIVGLDGHDCVGASAAQRLAAIESAGDGREIACADGVARVVASKRSPIRSHDEDVGTVTIVDDRTEFARLTSRLHAQEKLAALGNVASGIAHELRNPMNAIQGFASLLEKRLGAGSRERELAARIVEGVGRADQVLASMLTLARSDALDRRTFDVNELVEDAIREATLGFEHLERWALTHTTLPTRAATASGDYVKLRQALRNLIANALQAQPEGGAVHVEAHVDAAVLVLRVTDAGPGVPKELAARVLEPFFTSRADGSGLGLALVNTIAVLHGGRVELSSQPAPQGGADFRISIPFQLES